MQSAGFGVKERERIPFLSPKVFPTIPANSRPQGRAVTPQTYSSVTRITCTRPQRDHMGDGNEAEGCRRLDHRPSHSYTPPIGREASDASTVDTCPPGLVGRRGENERAENQGHPQPGGAAGGTQVCHPAVRSVFRGCQANRGNSPVH